MKKPVSSAVKPDQTKTITSKLKKFLNTPAPGLEIAIATIDGTMIQATYRPRRAS